MKTDLTVVIPTVARPSLACTLLSLAQQSGVERTEVLLVADTHSSPAMLDAVWTVVKRSGAHLPSIRMVGHDGGYSCVGHPQRNHAQTIAEGRYLAYIGDDDIFTQGALASILAAIDCLDGMVKSRPILFRVDTWQAGVIWREPKVREENVDAGCIVAPNDPARLGVWQPRYNGDADFIAETCAFYPSGPLWSEQVIQIGRPSDEEDWTGWGRCVG